MINDGLRLAIGMGCKNALAGLWWGGGKGVIGCPDGSSHMREEVYREFGLFLSRLNGCYVTAEDVGTKPQDMATIFSTTRFTTCIPAEFGGSGNPSPATARGVFVGIEAALRSLGISSMEGVTVALQGLGEVGSRLAAQLHEAGVNLVVFDPERITDTSTFESPIRYPEGIDFVMINGELTVEDGVHLGVRAGRTQRGADRLAPSGEETP